MSSELAGLQSLPRDLALGVRCRLLTGPVVLVGSGVFAFGMTFVLMMSMIASPLASWLLDQRHREAPGWLEAVEQTHYSESSEDEPSKPIYREEYTFELPDGQRLRGRSFTTSLPLSLPKGQLDPTPPPGLT